MGTEIIAANLRRLREHHGLSQEALADAAGLSRVAYRNIETRKSVPRVDTLQALAGALKVGIEALVSPVPHLRHVRFRSFKRLNSREQVLAEVARRLADFNELEELVGDKREAKMSAMPSSKGISRAIAAAAILRKSFRLSEDEPIRDICGLLEAHGFKVLLVNIATDAFFGLSVAKQDGGPAVVINDWERISVERRIFTAAHELGHLALHLGAFNVNQAAEEKREEKEANILASHLLMPERLFRKEWDETYGLPFVKRVLKVKRMFRVSYRTVLQRLADGHPAGPNYFAKFNVDYKKAFGTSLRKADEPEGLTEGDFHAPEPLRSGEPDNLLQSDFEEDRLSALVRRGVERELITLSRAAEILGKTLEEMRELSFSWVQ